MNKFIILAFSVFMVFLSSCSKEEQLKDAETTVELRKSRDIQVPRIVNGIMKFDSKKHLSSYVQKVLPLDDSSRVSIENSLNFQSLYTLIQFEGDDDQYDSKKYDIVRNGYKVFEKDSPYQIAMNDKNEVIVGNEYYKYVGDNLLVQVKDPTTRDIQDVRANKVKGLNTKLIDLSKDSTIVTPRSGCKLIISEPFSDKYDENVYLRFNIMDFDGFIREGYCTPKITIDWGDGKKTVVKKNTGQLNDVYRHKYVLPDYGGCVDYTINVTVDFEGSICGDFVPCASSHGNVLSSSRVVKVCGPYDCTDFEERRSTELISTHIYNDGKNRAKFYLGYDMENHWFREPLAWGIIKHYRKRSSGSWKRSAPKFASQIRIHGKAFEDNCNLSSARLIDEIDADACKTFDFTINLDEYSQSCCVSDYHLRNDERLYIDWSVFHISSVAPEPQVLNYPFF